MTPQPTFCATLVDEWARAGITDAVVAPGSRSTPMAVALASDGRLRVHVHHDERAAGFVAVGIGAVTGRPAVVLTTSGTAAAEVHPAVVEASQAGVPVIVCTADRPPELQHVGAPQTTDQTRLYGPAVRWFCAPGVPDDATRSGWRSLAARAWAEAQGVGGAGPGPVHLNLAFRDPLVGEPDELPPGRPGGAPWHRSAVGSEPAEQLVAELGELLTGRRGAIVAGGGAGDPTDVHALADGLGWPVLADPRSGARLPLGTTVAHADLLLRAGSWAAAAAPEVVLRLGAPHASKVLSQWLSDGPAAGAPSVAVVPAGRWFDPERAAARLVAADPAAVVARLLALEPGALAPAPDDWLTSWVVADQAADDAIAAVLSAHREPTEPGVARTVAATAPDGATLVVASSMPVRDVEWYGAPREGLTVVANRGANGIDGVVSTAVGVAIGSHRPTIALVGDIAFLHDANALVGAGGRGVDLVVVVVDNDGGGIFSFLPQAELLPGERFELLFGTPHRLDLHRFASGLDLPVATVAAAAELGPALDAAAADGGVSVIHVRTDRTANVAVHDELNAAVAAAL
ncbi:MAG: 2-succinyl-5-enolpyruvyl-6-hydroxy-3-cyclohexene-1-carboxylic-acid synthase [Acidimicrobiales bacterium]